MVTLEAYKKRSIPADRGSENSRGPPTRMLAKKIREEQNLLVAGAWPAVIVTEVVSWRDGKTPQAGSLQTEHQIMEASRQDGLGGSDVYFC